MGEGKQEAYKSKRFCQKLVYGVALQEYLGKELTSSGEYASA